MDKIMKFLYSILVLLLITGSAAAQGLAGFSYNVSLPTSNLKEFVKKTSFGGIDFEIRWFNSNNVSIGLLTGWNLFNEKTNKLIQIDDDGLNGAVSGTQIRTVNSFPFTVNAHYYLGSKRDPARFYFGAGAGVYYIRQRLEIGVNTFESNNWHFGITPEAGVLFQMNRYTSLIVKTNYNYAFSAGTTVGGNNDNSISYLGFSIGLVLQNF